MGRSSNTPKLIPQVRPLGREFESHYGFSTNQVHLPKFYVYMLRDQHSTPTFKGFDHYEQLPLVITKFREFREFEKFDRQRIVYLLVEYTYLLR